MCLLDKRALGRGGRNEDTVLRTLGSYRVSGSEARGVANNAVRSQEGAVEPILAFALLLFPATLPQCSLCPARSREKRDHLLASSAPPSYPATKRLQELIL